MTDATDDLEDQELYWSLPPKYDSWGQPWSDWDRIKHEELNKITIKNEKKTMSKELVEINFNEDQVKLIKTQIAPQANDNELKLFLYQAKRTGLDPLTRQIYCIHRNSKDEKGNWIKKMTIQTSIDGFRVIAERSGDYAGQDEPVFVEEEGKLTACKVTVYRFRGDVRYPAAVGVAYFKEYCQTDKNGNVTGMWLKMPRIMLAKVAEALALRKAYPQDLSGLYTGDEIPHEEPTATPLQNLANFADEEMRDAKEGEMLRKLKEALNNLGSVAEIDGYLEYRHNGKTRLDKINAMKEDNKAEGLKIIVDAKMAIDPENVEIVGEVINN